jgi:dTDP-4-dehydrorhamnose 3,5-epimerase
MKLIEEKLNGLKLFQFEVFFDERGSFCETFKESELQKYQISEKFIQENQSISKKNVIRGLHFQYDPPQSKLIRVINGKAKFVELDLRQDSSTFGQFAIFNIEAENFTLLWVPKGFANGFLSLTDNLIVSYKVNNYWAPQSEGTIFYDDTDLKIDWGIEIPIVSAKDKNGMTFKEFAEKKIIF